VDEYSRFSLVLVLQALSRI